MERRGYEEEYINRYKMMTRSVTANLEVESKNLDLH